MNSRVAGTGQRLPESQLPESVLRRRARRNPDKEFVPRRSRNTVTLADSVHAARLSAGSKGSRARAAMVLARNARSAGGVKEGAGETARALATGAVSKSTAVQGLDNLSRSPRSLRTWTSAAGRTAVAWSMAWAIGTPTASAIEERLHTFGYKRIIAYTFALVTLSGMTVVLAMVMVASIAASAVQVPMGIVDTVVGWFAGDDEDAPRIVCSVPDPLPSRDLGYARGYIDPAQSTAPATLEGTPVPAPTTPTDPSVVPTAPWATLPETYTAPPMPLPVPLTEEPAAPGPGQEAESSPTDAPADSGYTPPASITAAGEMSEQAHTLLGAVPRGADPRQAQTWLLYALTHPESDPHRTWDAFAGVFASALDELRTIGEAEGRATDAEATALDIVERIDIRPYYAAHELAAVTGVIELGREGIVKLTSAQDEQLYAEVVRTCGVE